MKKIFSLMAIAVVGVTFTACHNSLDDERAAIQENEIAAKKTAFQEAFTKTFGEISGNQDWGFGEDLKYPTIDMSTSSPLFTDENSAARALTRGSQVPVKYTDWNQLQKMTDATAYYFIRIDNEIIKRERDKANANPSAWIGMPADEYWPKTPQYNSDSNEGKVDMAKIFELTGKNFIFNELGVDNEVLRQVPSFETVISWIGQGGDKDENYYKTIQNVCKNFKDVIWYVAKWQQSGQQGGDNVIHVDGILTDVSRTIICEDLGSIGDFDYNDAVFDVTIYSDQDGNHAKITLKAAGGTLKLTVGNQEIHEALLKGKTYENGSYPMINTGAGVTADPVEIIYHFPDNVKNNFINNIPVVVTYKDGSTKTLEATKGQAPEKIAVLKGFECPSEKQNIKSKYSHFKDYVADTTGEWNAPKWYEN